MKVKQYVLINRLDKFLAGNMDCFTLHDNTDMDGYDGRYFLCGEVEFDVDVDTKMLTQKAVEVIERELQEEMAQHQVRVDLLATKKANLLSITHQP